MTWPAPLHLCTGRSFLCDKTVAAYTKPYLTPAQQIQLLQSRGMEVSDIAKAEAYLSRIGYYRLSAYWYPFRTYGKVTLPNGKIQRNVKDDFQPGTRFSDCLDLYVFDKKLRLLVMDGLERVEIALRTDIALLLGQSDVLAHTNEALLHNDFTNIVNPNNGKTEHDVWLEKQNASFRRSKEEFVKHFKSKYPNDEMPIWMAVELWDFGMLSYFFGGMRKIDQNKIATAYSLPHGRILESWLRCLNVLRNSCAHHTRLWNKPLVITPSWPKLQECAELDHLIGVTQSQTRFYASAVILKYLLKLINPSSSWGDRLKAHMSTLPKATQLNLTAAGFPLSWEQEAIWNGSQQDS